MPKTKKKPNNKLQIPLWLQWTLMAAVLILGIASVILWQRLSLAEENLTTLAQSTAERVAIEERKNSYREPVVDMANNQVLLPELNLSVPYNEETRTWLYRYGENREGSFYLWITSWDVFALRGTLSMANYDCIDTVKLYSSPRSTNAIEKKLEPIELSDDRTLYPTVPSTDICGMFYESMDIDLDEVIDNVRKITTSE